VDGLFRRSYPPRVLRRLRAFFPRRCERDLEEMVRPGSYLGINYYTRIRYRASAFLPFSHAVEVSPPGAPRSAMWEIFPEGMYRSLLRLKDEYGNPPCYVTENGFPLPETPRADPLEDGERIAYLADHVAQMANAVREGVDCRGYFCWSLLDNFEWNRGLSMRFGLLRTDFQTQQRSWKRSAAWYRELLRRNHIPPAPAPGL
jgi:beta-glucosidase